MVACPRSTPTGEPVPDGEPSEVTRANVLAAGRSSTEEAAALQLALELGLSSSHGAGGVALSLVETVVPAVCGEVLREWAQVVLVGDRRNAVVGDEPGAPRDALRFIHPTTVLVPALLGATQLDAWHVELYTAEIVAGAEAGARRAAVQRRRAAEIGFIDAITDPPPGSYRQFGAVHTRPTAPTVDEDHLDDGGHPGASR